MEIRPPLYNVDNVRMRFFESPQVFRRYAIVATKEQETAFEARAQLLASETDHTRSQGRRFVSTTMR